MTICRLRWSYVLELFPGEDQNLCAPTVSGNLRYSHWRHCQKVPGECKICCQEIITAHNSPYFVTLSPPWSLYAKLLQANHIPNPTPHLTHRHESVIDHLMSLLEKKKKNANVCVSQNVELVLHSIFDMLLVNTNSLLLFFSLSRDWKNSERWGEGRGEVHRRCHQQEHETGPESFNTSQAVS